MAWAIRSLGDTHGNSTIGIIIRLTMVRKNYYFKVLKKSVSKIYAQHVLSFYLIALKSYFNTLED